ncbi:MAG TPA: hypothetical protein ENI64_08520, partial [Gammaproteobacteria bacterium]|nr:hypothetical protein [Gammaproteobacteria bacterium]
MKRVHRLSLQQILMFSPLPDNHPGNLSSLPALKRILKQDSSESIRQKIWHNSLYYPHSYPRCPDSAMSSVNHIGQLTIDHFLQEYWQKAPVILRQALPDLPELITPEELAGLACEDFVESRLVTVLQEAPGWLVKHGPFSEQDFTSLPESNYSLLVQDVEKHLPDLRRL